MKIKGFINIKIMDGVWLILYMSINILIDMIASAIDTVVYAFSNVNSKNSSMPFGGTGWEPLALVNGGKWYELSQNATKMYLSLMEIIDKEVCGNE